MSLTPFRVLITVLVVYTAIACVYTTHRLFISGPATFDLPSRFLSQSVTYSSPTRLFCNKDKLSFPLNELSEAGKPQLYWPLSTAPRLVPPSSEPYSMSEELFLRKTFSSSMQPSQVIPYYYRASGQFDREDITITTLITSNRFQVFARLVQQYKGPISVTIHVSDQPGDRDQLLDALHVLYTTTPGMNTWVDVHLVLDKFERQFNMWRNVARFFSRTDFVMMLDVDFAICTDFRARVRNSVEIMAKLRQGTAAFVVPAFEYTKQSDGLDSMTFPRDKESLLALVREEKIGMFHASWPPGHNSTNYERFYTAEPGEVYRVVDYQHAYEPYVIFKKEGAPWCDERFIGYGSNKAACLFEMHLSGISFYVLSDDFLIHQSHDYAEEVRKHERKYNRKLFTDYREETCFRYLKYFLDIRQLDSEKGHNVQAECRKIKGVAKIAAELIGGQTP